MLLGVKKTITFKEKSFKVALHALSHLTDTTLGLFFDCPSHPMLNAGEVERHMSGAVALRFCGFYCRWKPHTDSYRRSLDVSGFKFASHIGPVGVT